MVGVLIVNGRPLILSNIKDISRVYEVDGTGFTNYHYITPGTNVLKPSGFNSNGEHEYYAGDHYFLISMESGKSNWKYVFFYKTRQEAEEALLELTNKINNVLASIPKIEI